AHLPATFQITFGMDPRLPAILGRDAQKTIGLWDVVGAKTRGGAGSVVGAGGRDAVVAEPTLDETVWLAMLVDSDRRSHIHDAVDQFGLFHLRHGLIAAQEFSRTQMITALKRRSAAARA